jgi:hypothetical protein
MPLNKIDYSYRKFQYVRMLRKLFMEGKICIELLEDLLLCENESLN